jgi:hypothetical protein
VYGNGLVNVFKPSASCLVAMGFMAALTRSAGADDEASSGATTRSETSGEVGLELDSNVQRVEEVDPQADPVVDSAPAPTPAALGSLGARLDLAATSAAGSLLTLGMAANLRSAVTSRVTSENLAQVSLDAQWLRAVRDGDLRIGPRIGYRDALEIAGGSADRTFRSFGGDLAMVFFGGGSRVAVSVGPHLFSYKSDSSFSWRGAGATVRGDFPLWRGGESDERSLELSAVAAIEQRGFRSIAFANVCPPDEKITQMCFVTTPRQRGDRVHRASLQLAYTGAVVATAESQLLVVDSNSFGRSSLGTRLRAAITGNLGKWYLSGTATVQTVRYLDGLLVALDSERRTLDVLEDDRRSSLEFRVGRPVSGRWSVEARWAGWRDLSADLRYRRQLAYLGVVWGR